MACADGGFVAMPAAALNAHGDVQGRGASPSLALADYDAKFSPIDTAQSLADWEAGHASGGKCAHLRASLGGDDIDEADADYVLEVYRRDRDAFLASVEGVK
jgi:hypothetical protein